MKKISIKKKKMQERKEARKEGSKEGRKSWVQGRAASQLAGVTKAKPSAHSTLPVREAQAWSKQHMFCQKSFVKQKINQK